MENNHGYTDDMWQLHNDIRIFARWMHTLVRLGVVQTREAQIMTSNYGQQRFQRVRDGEML